MRIVLIHSNEPLPGVHHLHMPLWFIYSFMSRHPDCFHPLAIPNKYFEEYPWASVFVYLCERCSGVCARRWDGWCVGHMPSTVAPPVHTPARTRAPGPPCPHLDVPIWCLESGAHCSPPLLFFPGCPAWMATEGSDVASYMLSTPSPFKTSGSNGWVTPHLITGCCMCTKHQLGHSQLGKGWCGSLNTYPDVWPAQRWP